jgi:hypothetical protein
VFKVSRTVPWPPLLDLHSVRRNLAPIQQDLASMPALAKASIALEAVIAEIDAAERATNAARLHDSNRLQLSRLVRRSN